MSFFVLVVCFYIRRDSHVSSFQRGSGPLSFCNQYCNSANDVFMLYSKEYKMKNRTNSTKTTNMNARFKQHKKSWNNWIFDFSLYFRIFLRDSNG